MTEPPRPGRSTESRADTGRRRGIAAAVIAFPILAGAATCALVGAWPGPDAIRFGDVSGPPPSVVRPLDDVPVVGPPIVPGAPPDLPPATSGPAPAPGPLAALDATPEDPTAPPDAVAVSDPLVVPLSDDESGDADDDDLDNDLDDDDESGDADDDDETDDDADDSDDGADDETDAETDDDADESDDGVDDETDDEVDDVET